MLQTVMHIARSTHGALVLWLWLASLLGCGGTANLDDGGPGHAQAADDAMPSADPAAIQEEEDDYRRERQRIEDRRDRRIEKLRAGE